MMNTGKQKPGKRYPLVNWADGMPVNKKHLSSWRTISRTGCANTSHSS